MSDSQLWRRVGKGLLVPVLPGVFRVGGAPETQQQRVLAACLWAGSGSAASYRTAGAFHRFCGRGSAPVEITSSRRLHPPEGVVLHEDDLEPCDVATVGGIPLTTGARTLLDLAGVLAPTDLEQALDDALSRGLPLARVRWVLSRVGGPGKRGSRELRRLLDTRSGSDVGLESPLETRLLRLLRAAQLPLPHPQLTVKEEGRTVARVDFAYPEQRIALETDGWQWHSSRQAWRRDRVRQNELTNLGWRVLHITADDLKRRPDVVVANIGRILADTRSGW